MRTLISLAATFYILDIIGARETEIGILSVLLFLVFILAAIIEDWNNVVEK